MHKFLLFIIVFISFLRISAQTGSISGMLSDENDRPISYANIYLEGTTIGATSDTSGKFRIENIPYNDYSLVITSLEYEKFSKAVKINGDISGVHFQLKLAEKLFDQVVVTGTKTFQSRFSSPVIVQVLENKSLEQIQACNLAEGLRFQPGLRVETDCQTCNYSQLRINGLGGGYSQILINGRPIFSALNSLYGLEQIPRNMVDRIETVKGGGSALYGSNAIGGTVNVITKIPDENNYSLDYSYQNINAQTSDHLVNFNGTLLNKKKNVGTTLYFSSRNRGTYDHNGDNFSELSSLKNNAIGTNFIYKPKDKQKLEISLNYLNEYRYGGEMIKNVPAQQVQQAEERTHHTFMGSVDYQVNFNQENSSFIVYLANQTTSRDHFTGISPDEPQELIEYLENPPYGNSKTYTINTGTQINHKVKKFILGSNTFTGGIDISIDDVYDRIDAYNYLVDQQSTLIGTFVQSDWKLSPKVNLLSGLRMDKSNFVDQLIFNPRFSLMYKPSETGQFRISWGQGFRAPQAFDADLHIAFAGGGVSRVILDPSLREERSHSVSASYNYNKAQKKFVYGFTLDGFYTALKNTFYLQPIGEDSFGEVFEKRNGPGAKVMGANIDFRLNYNKVFQFETGFTIQSNLFNEAIETIPNVPAQRKFLRTPQAYGYSIMNIMPSDKFYINFNTVHTGRMDVAHFAGAPEQEVDEIITTRIFNEFGAKAAYTFSFPKINTKMELFGGLKNIFNAYQDDFDTSKNRDSNFVYGPAMPRTFFIGIQLKSW